MNGDGYLFPHPPKNDRSVLAVVVEKKGDETKTSMRQSEIYAYSYDIIIRDGYMVMPKISWKNFEPGDWFVCRRAFSLDRHDQQKEERELFDLQKVTNPAAYPELEIPPTRFVNGNVQIIEDFMLCPEFIRNRAASNSYGKYKKIFIKGIGQGFIHSLNDHLVKAVKPGRVYTGVLEFRAKDNGAVNFGHRNEWRDHTGHVLERDAMWELMKLKRQTAGKPLSEHQVMRKEIETLRENAQKFDAELQIKRSKQKTARQDQTIRAPTSFRQRSISSSVRKKTLTGNARADALRAELARLSLLQSQQVPNENLTITVMPEDSTIVAQSDEQNTTEYLGNTRFEFHHRTLLSDQAIHPIPNVFRNAALTDVPVVIKSIPQLEAHRERVIMRATFQEAGSDVKMTKWIDRETNETSTECDILNYKFDVRHGRFDDPPFGVAIAATNPAPPFHDNDMSTFSNVTAIEREPLAASTPRTSPLFPRRQFDCEQAQETFQNRRITEPEQNNNTIDPDETITATTFEEIRRDNNANPTRRRFTFADFQR